MNSVQTREAVLASARVRLDALRAEQEASTPPEAASATTSPVVPGGLELTALSDLLTEPDEAVDYLVEERIACGSVALLAGKPKAGKSTAARGLALEVARCGSWLGFSCLPRPVWYLALEDKRSEVRRHFRMMGATGADPVRFVFRQPTDGLLDELHARAEREHPGLNRRRYPSTIDPGSQLERLRRSHHEAHAALDVGARDRRRCAACSPCG